ncbi:hypothetical protein C8A01DRAFT_14735 [Parachaetomium inaequale]|uniref:Uncharacterized protein n=1 Tax=Parachaetomium inaequale TaxID=2588326 RepID=A0AAN6PLZ2_9PEZI|nr:hypothetical protein C8A01DRAFT_14735 [Parachaetomium inaequale]
MASQSDAKSYPLETTTEAELRALSQALWRWHECPAARGSGPGCEAACPWPRHPRLAQFHALYRQLAASYVPDMDYGRSPALRHHGDLFDIIKSLKAQPDVSRTQLMSQYFDTRQAANDSGGEEMPTPEDQERAFSLAARVMTTVACSGEDAASAVLELGTEPVPWRGETSISQFLLAAFPLANTLSLASLPGSRRNQDVRLFLSAETITKIGHLRLQPTDDIRSHLNLDSKSKAVQIYQQTALLKEHLRATEHLADTATIAETIQVGNIPRQLALEVLDSLNSILFPPMTKSHGILRALVSKGVFDRDMLQLESRDVRHRHEVEGEYRYLASKLRDLYDEVENPTPRGRFERWFERRIAQRYFMMATFGGLVVAIILGILGLAVGIFQAWVAYQQWKFPVGGS